MKIVLPPVDRLGWHRFPISCPASVILAAIAALVEEKEQEEWAWFPLSIINSYLVSWRHRRKERTS